MTSGIRTFGIDVAHYNNVVDWDTALAGAPAKIHFCFAKASQLYYDGSGKLIQQHDRQFDRNWRELTRLNMPKGAYHYCMPDFSADDMAKLFFSVYAPAKGDLIPSLDIEDEYVKCIAAGRQTSAQLVQQILDFGGIVEKKIGRKPFIYTRTDITNALGNPGAFEEYPLWIANYNNPPTPILPQPWNDYAFWQYSQSGSWPGFPSTPGNHNDVDFNYLNGDPSQLANYLI
jgi:lysozyme